MLDRMTTAAHDAGTPSSAADSSLQGRIVSEVMHHGVITCSPAAPVRYVAHLMVRAGIHAVVVWGDVEDDSEGIWGLVSDLDLVRAALRGGTVAQSAVGAARTHVLTVRADDTLAHAAELMEAHRLAHLVVVDERARPIGILSTLDMARAVAADD